MADHEKEKERERDKDRDKEKHAAGAAETGPASTHGTTHGTTHANAATHLTGTPPGKNTQAADEDVSGAFFSAPLVGFDASEITGTLIVIEGLDGSGRSTQISLLQEWLESEGFAVQTSGLRRSNLVGRDIDELLAKNAVTRLTLALMYCTDFFDQLEHRIVPAL